MTDDATELPVFPTTAPAVFCDPDATRALFGDVLGRLAELVDLDDDQLSLPTPCAQYDAGQLRSHVLGWLGFFAAALCDPAATSPRPDPEGLELVVGDPASALVRRNLEQIQQAIADDAAGQMVTMMSSRMAGDGVLGMALGEYIVHGWDLATATGQSYDPPDALVAEVESFAREVLAPMRDGVTWAMGPDSVSDKSMMTNRNSTMMAPA